MAVRDEAGRWYACALVCGFFCSLATPLVAEAQATLPSSDETPTAIETPSATALAWLRSGAERVNSLLHEARKRTRRGEPEWLQRQRGNELAERAKSSAACDPCLVLQEDRPDGTELVTARYTLHDSAALRTYAGAGLNRVQYFRDDPDDPRPTRLGKGNRHTSIGAAAEVGAELQMSTRLRIAADLRWVELDGQALALRTEHGPVTADPLMLGLSIGYRFR
jgi:hypothetical protein